MPVASVACPYLVHHRTCCSAMAHCNIPPYLTTMPPIGTTNYTTKADHNATRYHGTTSKSKAPAKNSTRNTALYHKTLYLCKGAIQSNLSYDHIAPLSLPHTVRYIEARRRKQSVQYLTSGTPCPSLRPLSTGRQWPCGNWARPSGRHCQPLLLCLLGGHTC